MVVLVQKLFPSKRSVLRPNDAFKVKRVRTVQNLLVVVVCSTHTPYSASPPRTVGNTSSDLRMNSRAKKVAFPERRMYIGTVQLTICGNRFKNSEGERRKHIQLFLTFLHSGVDLSLSNTRNFNLFESEESTSNIYVILYSVSN